MSTRSTPLPISKTPSLENVCKFKEDRLRSNNNSYKYKQRNDNGNSSKHAINFSNQSCNKKSQSNYQKQPQSRKVWGGKRTKVTIEQREEMGGKKVNLNHLLNFTYEHEEAYHDPGKVGFRSKYATRDKFYNKEQFIQANCQLILKEGGNYTNQLTKLDMPVEWDEVEKVNIWREEIPTCPICLGDFCAAQMTKCGHIYCWPCILHYLALDDKSWRKCPICHEAVHKKDLRSVNVHEQRRVDLQTLITMQLMKRRRGSNYAVPVGQQFNDDDCFNFDETLTASEQRNAKYLLASPDQVLENFVKVEKAQLEFKLATETDEFEQTFVKSALELCQQRTVELEKLSSMRKKKDVTQNAVKKSPANSCTEIFPGCLDNEVTSSEQSGELKCGAEGGNKDLKPIEKDTDQTVYFYQAIDGQHVYLHPLNARCLIEEHGSYSRCPTKINAKILEREEFSMTEETRKRYRHLAHLPLSLEFRIVELDLRPPLVSAKVLSAFQAALDRRAAFRRKKARDEKRILRKAHNEAMKRQGRYPASNFSLENQQQFPEIQQQTPGSSYSVLFPSPGSTPGSESAMPSTSALDVSSDGSLASSTSENSLSFAQMLKASGGDEHVTWPRRAPIAVKCAPIIEKPGDSEDENFAAPPTYQSSFGDAICAALESMSTPSGNGNALKSKKRKKAKKKVLFSTSGQHH